MKAKILALMEKGRTAIALALAAGVVVIDSASRLLSMCADMVIVAALVAVLTLYRPRADK